MSSKIEPLEIEENSPNSNKGSSNNGYYVSKNLIIILAVVVSLVYAGSIIATYFGKPDAAANQGGEYCQTLLCQNSTLLTSTFTNIY